MSDFNPLQALASIKGSTDLDSLVERTEAAKKWTREVQLAHMPLESDRVAWRYYFTQQIEKAADETLTEIAKSVVWA